jgi:tetratricopeptide (TPR) repeat protein
MRIPAFTRLGVIPLAAVVLLPLSFARAATDPGDVALAERLSDTARLTLTGTRTPTTETWQLAGTLLEAAVKLNPTEPRYSRLWAEAMLRGGDEQGAIRALKAYLAVNGDDKTALIQYADLFANSFDAIDKRLDYLLQWVDNKQVPDEVRSHIAFLASQAYAERSQVPQAKAMLDRALTLNPLSMEVLRERYKQVAADGTPFERISTLLAILKSNPAQIEYVAEIAARTADVGLASPSLQFYGLGFNLANRLGRGIPRPFALGYASELFVFNQLDPAKQLVDSLLTSNSGDYDAVALRLMIERAKEQKDQATKSIAQMEILLYNRIQSVRQGLGAAGATTRPVDAPPPADWGSLADDVKKLTEFKGEQAEAMRATYSQTLAETAWVETYFRQSPADAKPFVDALRQLLPDDSATLARLDGWAALVRGDKDTAKLKLSAIQDRDPLAAIGMVRLMDGDASQKAGQELLARYPSGLLAAQILDGLRDRKVALVPNPQTTGPIIELLSKFPADWLKILDQPQSFYVLRAEPLKIAHAFGEPMFVRISVQNISDFPITIGSEGTPLEGVLHPDLWIDVQFRGMVQQAIPGAGYDRLAGEVVLKPRSSISQIVRVDQGQVTQLLTASPFPSLQMVMQIRTNPLTTSQSGIGPAGQVVQGSKMIERDRFALTDPSLNALQQALQQGGPAEKIRCMDLASAIANVLGTQKDNKSAMQAATRLLELVQADARDSSSSPSVAAWAAWTVCRHAGDADKPKIISNMINDPSWTSRLLGLVMVYVVPFNFDVRLNVTKQVVAHETDPIVLEYAKSLTALLERASTVAASATKPTTGAATQPSTTQPTGPSPLLPPGPSTIPPTLPPTPTVNPPTPAPMIGGPGTPTTKPGIGTGTDVVLPTLPFTLPPAGPPMPATQPAAK